MRRHKSLFTVATHDGKCPTMPQTTSNACYRHFETCKRYNPDGGWMVFELGQTQNGFPTTLKNGPWEVMNPGIADEVKERLLMLVAERFGLGGVRNEA